MVIRHAETLEDLIAGRASAVPASKITADYVNGLVTFRVSRLSVFGIGTKSANNGGGSGGGCFVDSSQSGSHLIFGALTIIAVTLSALICLVRRQKRVTVKYTG